LLIVSNGCPLGQAGLFPVFFYPQISQIGFINSLSAFFCVICVICGFTVRFLIELGLLREWAAALGQAGVREAVSALVSCRDFDTFFCVRVFLFDGVAQFV
jgi:hypothetical protein